MLRGKLISPSSTYPNSEADVGRVSPLGFALSVKYDKAARTRTFSVGTGPVSRDGSDGCTPGFKMVFGPAMAGLDDRALAPYLVTPSDVESPFSIASNTKTYTTSHL